MVALRSKTTARATAVLVAVATLMTSGGAVAAPRSHGGPRYTVGAAGAGDDYFPYSGNGGYDVQHYDVDLTYGNKFSDPVDGTVNILARATQSLSRFDLDFSGESVGSVAVNGAPASLKRDGQELIITPKKAINNGSLFIVTVSHFVAVPGTDPSASGLLTHPDGTVTAPQPDLARTFLPSNDHPSDKASYDIRFDVPPQYTAVANGVQVLNSIDRGRRHVVFVQRQPMATELIQLAVGNYDVTPEGFHNGVFLREVTSRSLTREYLPLLDKTPSQLDWMKARAGAYPFDLYGSLVVTADLGFALETQTLELIDTFWNTDYGRGTWDATLLHEMSHMWVRRLRGPEVVERSVDQRGSRLLVRVHLGRGERRARGGHRGLPGRQRLRDPR